MDTSLIARLNDPLRANRLAALHQIADGGQAKTLHGPATVEVNNHVHTIYSFSPYAPAMAALQAAKAGLQAVGIMDHDSVSGCAEMLQAGKSLEIATTCGFEVRVNATGTALEGRKINNPDSVNILYMAVHGLPATQFERARTFLAGISRERNLRNRAQVERLNARLTALGLRPLDFDRDVAAISCAAEGGSITERHILCALAKRIAESKGRGQPLIAFLRDQLGMELPAKLQEYMTDAANPHFLYDLLGVLKSSFLPAFFIQPNEQECPPVGEVVRLALEMQAIPAYAYLGDVTESPTGDKKAEKFEDDYLDLLVGELGRIGFRAITYMPPRNTLAQLARVQRLCQQYNLMEISGVDINSSRQTFSCPIILKPEFAHLVEATWALIAHEKLATLNPEHGLFHPRNPLAGQPLAERLRLYARIGRKIDNRAPERAALDLA
ncbi:MAG: PHP domain-containing protein [Lentisphaeria bacterium]